MKKFEVISLLMVLVLSISLMAGCDKEQINNEEDTYVGNPDGIENKLNQSGSKADPLQDLSKFHEEVKDLQGQEAYDYFDSLVDKGLNEAEILQFFIDLPLSDSNPGIVKQFEEEEFAKYMSTYPKGLPFEDYSWTKGNGTNFHGQFSDLDLKLPFSNYVGILDGFVGDEDKTYRIGVAIHGFDQPWCVGLADAAKWEADRHPNVEVIVKDAQWDNDQMADIIDSFILQKVDGILTWPMVEHETTIAPVARSIEAGIPVVSVDRMTGLEETTSRITGNFPANGAQSGMYLIWKLAEEGSISANVAMLRKPLGSTADAIRSGHFLKVLSYFPEINIVSSLHDHDNTAEAYANAQVALEENPVIDVFFGTGDHEAIAAYGAAEEAGRLKSRDNGNKIIFLSIDDSKTAITNVKNGKFELNTPYTPLVADIGMRTLINIVTGDKQMPHDIITPNIPMVTQNGDVIFGIKSQTPDQWYEYTFGPPLD